jgi:hypothetical protein
MTEKILKTGNFQKDLFLLAVYVKGRVLRDEYGIKKKIKLVLSVFALKVLKKFWTCG